jgi:hypothetical protein
MQSLSAENSYLYNNYPTFSPSNVCCVDTGKKMQIRETFSFLRVSFVGPFSGHLQLPLHIPGGVPALPLLPLSVSTFRWITHLTVSAGLATAENKTRDLLVTGQVPRSPPFEFSPRLFYTRDWSYACACPESGSQTGPCELPSPSEASETSE